MPAYDVCERHAIHIAAPAETTLAAAKGTELESSRMIRGIFRARELLLRARPDTSVRPHGMLAQLTAMGWAVIAETPGREIVLGAVTKPWEPNPVFRTIPADQFTAFAEPDYVKIAVTLRADPDEHGSTFRTETRAVATDAEARRKFRWYWALLSPGIIFIRVAMLPAVKAAAEHAA